MPTPATTAHSSPPAHRQLDIPTTSAPSIVRRIRIDEEFGPPGRRPVYIDRLERDGDVVRIFLSVRWATANTKVPHVVVEGVDATVREVARRKHFDLVAELPASEYRPRRGAVTLIEDGRQRTVDVSFDDGGIENWFIGKKRWE